MYVTFAAHHVHAAPQISHSFKQLRARSNFISTQHHQKPPVVIASSVSSPSLCVVRLVLDFLRIRGRYVVSLLRALRHQVSCNFSSTRPRLSARQRPSFPALPPLCAFAAELHVAPPCSLQFCLPAGSAMPRRDAVALLRLEAPPASCVGLTLGSSWPLSLTITRIAIVCRTNPQSLGPSGNRVWQLPMVSLLTCSTHVMDSVSPTNLLIIGSACD